jgi:ribose transport system ATP-binding protein
VLRVESLTKRYPGVVALDDVTLEVRPREVLGLIGENGAGKSTLLKILGGLQRSDAGRVVLRGTPVRFGSPRAAADAGIGMVYQEQSLLPNISVAENLFLGAEGTSVRGGWYRWRSLRARAREQLDKLGLDINPAMQTDALTFGQRQMVELAKAIAIEDRTEHDPVVLLDEPTSVLEAKEVEILFAQIRRLRERASVIFVSHRLDEVLAVSDRVYVMKDARCVAERIPSETTIPELHSLMVGHELSGSLYHADRQRDPGQEPLLEVRGLVVGDAVDGVDLDVRAGEVVGLAGVGGSGREALCRAIFGAEPIARGEIRLQGRPFRADTPAAAVRAGVGYVPAERRTEGAALGMSVAENVSLAHLEEVTRGPFIDAGRERALVEGWIERLRIKTPSPSVAIGTLSGGNQQKAVLAKWLLSPQLKLLILDHPTRGLDVGAKAEVYGLIRDLVEKGIGVLLMADTLEETIALSHRIVVLRDGRVTRRFDAPPDAKPEQVDLVEGMV